MVINGCPKNVSSDAKLIMKSPGAGIVPISIGRVPGRSILGAAVAAVEILTIEAHSKAVAQIDWAGPVLAARNGFIMVVHGKPIP